MDTADLRARLRAQPGGEQLLAAAPPGAFLVGGAVRDLLLGRAPRELDVVLAGPGGATQPSAAAAVARLAGELTARLVSAGAARGGRASEHERFGTAIVEWDGGRIDLAVARRERYAAPGALPEVEPAPLSEDLLRRDFTVNAIAVALDESERDGLRAAPHALEDLRAGRLRVLHEHSFRDDPTRLWRLARYRARLGFAVQERTAALARDAVASGALATVSGARVGAELRLALAEPDPLAALAELDRLGALHALHPRLRLEPALVERAAELMAAERVDRLALAALVLPLALRAAGDRALEIAALLERLEFTAGERDRVASAAAAVPTLIDELPAAARPSLLRAVALRVPLEGVALAGALSAPAAAPARRWLRELRDVRLRIGGGDLLAAGAPEGPEIGWRLEETLRMRLDGELPDERGAQLRAALALLYGRRDGA
jgi:tRNA nucleotidyltransferase (CCA-adding enzyme)